MGIRRIISMVYVEKQLLSGVRRRKRGGDGVNKTYMDGLAEGYEAAMEEIQRILEDLSLTHSMLKEHLEEIYNHPDISVEVTA